MVFARFRRPGKCARNDDWPTSVRGWRQWLDTTDRLGPRELAHGIHQAIRTLNRRDMSPRQRVHVVERLQPAVRRALEYLANRAQAQPLPLPTQARAAYRIMLDLLAELARAYETVLFADARRPSRRLAVLACERALACHGERGLRIMQTYAPLDDRFWPRVNQVYRAAEMAGVAGTRVAIAGTRSKRQSPAAMYKRLLLFALAGTQGIRRDEAGRLYRALESWSGLAILETPVGDVGSDLPRFAIDLESDRGPVLLEDDGTAPSTRILDVSDLVVHIEQLRAESDPQYKAVSAEDEVGYCTLSRLLDSWMPGTYQRSRRARRGSEVDAEVTLPVIHARITGEQQPAEDVTITRPEPPPDWELEPIAESDMALSRDSGGIRPGVNWNEIPQGRDFSPGHEDARAVESAVRGASGEPLEPCWILEDVSATGFRLIWEGRGSCRVAVGEVIALRIDGGKGSSTRWCIGIVRRMRFLDERRFEIGVQALVRSARPVQLDHLPPKPNIKRCKAHTQEQPALLLPANPGSGVAATLLVPAHTLSPGDLIELAVNGRRSRFTLGRLVEDTGTVSRYELNGASRWGGKAQRG